MFEVKRAEFSGKPTPDPVEFGPVQDGTIAPLQIFDSGHKIAETTGLNPVSMSIAGWPSPSV